MSADDSRRRCSARRWLAAGYRHQCQVTARPGTYPPLCGLHLRTLPRWGLHAIQVRAAEREG